MSDAEHPAPDPQTATVPGRRCANCQHFSLSPVQVCPECLGSELHADGVPGDGVVYSRTVVRAGPRDRDLPYGLAYVDLRVGVRVLANFPVGDPVLPGDAVTVHTVGRTDDGLPLLALGHGTASAT